jgi:hypothetical protein
VRFPSDPDELVSLADNQGEFEMKMRTLVLGSAAGLSLAGALALATPGFAQSDMNPPQVSTPAERQQTQQLNGQAADGTTASPAQLNGDANAGPSQSQSQYDAQQQQYQQQQQQYQDQKARYQDQRARYDQDIRRYDTAQYYFTDYPRRVYAYRYDNDSDLRQLYLIADPTHQLAQAPVEGPDGQWVGKVRNVEAGVDGRPRRVEVALNRRVSVWVSPGSLRFDPENHIVFTNLTRADLWQLPGATYESETAYHPY